MSNLNMLGGQASAPVSTTFFTLKRNDSKTRTPTNWWFYTRHECNFLAPPARFAIRVCAHAPHPPGPGALGGEGGCGKERILLPVQWEHMIEYGGEAEGILEKIVEKNTLETSGKDVKLHL